jgi:type VI secretion system secreted protein VgrG
MFNEIPRLEYTMNSRRSIKLQGKRFLVIGSVIALGIGFISTTANAVEAPISMGAASTYGVLANAGITSATPSGITGTAGGDIGVGNAVAPTGTITISGTQVLGGSSIAALTAASAALADNRAGTTTVVELGGGRTITPGAYTAGTLEVNGSLTLDGGGVSTSVFIFRASSTLITGTASTVVLTNGAQACNVFWQVGSSATLGAGSTMSGHVIAQASISTGATSTVNGQLIGITGAVTLGGTTVVNNACTTPAPAATAAATPAATAAATPAATAAPVVTATPAATAVPVITATPVVVVTPTATLHIVKKVINTFGGTYNPMSFVMHVIQNGIDVAGSPSATLGDTGKTYILAPGSYILYEERVAGYRGTWSGNISTGGTVNLVDGQVLTVTRTNFDLNPTPGQWIVADTATATTPVTPTETGGVLPNTSTPWGNELLLGAGLVLLGTMGFTTRKFLAK